MGQQGHIGLSRCVLGAGGSVWVGGLCLVVLGLLGGLMWGPEAVGVGLCVADAFVPA
jgi:hypothetical protein